MARTYVVAVGAVMTFALGCNESEPPVASAEYLSADDGIGAPNEGPGAIGQALAQQAATEVAEEAADYEMEPAEPAAEGVAEARSGHSRMALAPRRERHSRSRRQTGMFAARDIVAARGAGGYAAASTATAAPRPAAPMPQALPQNGVLASNFVGGTGARARLEDLLDRGVSIDGELVRLEAFQERDRLPYPLPRDEGMALYAELERSQLHTGTELVHMQIAMLGRQGEAPRRPRMQVRLVMDRSGSMLGEKWMHAVRAAHEVVNHLQPNDRFALISYSDDASLDVAPRRVGDRRAIHAAIDRLVPGGGTNIGAALELAERHGERGESDVGMTLLVSDGRASVGQTNADALGAIARRTFDAEGTLTTAIGLGSDFDERTMLTIAREGSGSYHFVRRAADIGDILEDELEARAQAVAQALRLKIELGDGVRARRVYGSRMLDEQEHAAVRATEVATDARIARELGIARTRQREEEEGLRIHLPTFRRGDQHVVLMELEVPAGTSATQIATVTLDYKDLIRRRNASLVREVRAERTSDRSVATASVERLVKRTVLAFQAGEALQEAADALQRGDHANARRILAERRELLSAASGHWRDPALGQDAQLLARYERVLGSSWGSWDHGSQNTLVMAMNYFGDQRMR